MARSTNFDLDHYGTVSEATGFHGSAGRLVYHRVTSLAVL